MPNNRFAAQLLVPRLNSARIDAFFYGAILHCQINLIELCSTPARWYQPWLKGTLHFEITGDKKNVEYFCSYILSCPYLLNPVLTVQGRPVS